MKRRILLSAPIGWAFGGLVHAAPQAYDAGALVDIAGDRTSLRAQAAGNTLVVVVMKGHWCPVCRAQLSRLATQRSKLEELGAKVVGLNADPVAANHEIARRMALPFQILADLRHQVLSALGLWLRAEAMPMPAVVVFDACGVERGRWVGRRPGERIESPLFDLLRQLHSDDCRRANA